MTYQVLEKRMNSFGKWSNKLVETVTNKEDAELIVEHCERFHPNSHYAIERVTEEEKKNAELFSKAIKEIKDKIKFK